MSCQLYQGSTHLHAKLFCSGYPNDYSINGEYAESRGNKEWGNWIGENRSPCDHTHTWVWKRRCRFLYIFLQKLFPEILTVFSSSVRMPSTATIWYCFSFKPPTNLRSSLRPVPSVLCFKSFCISWEGHPGSNSSKHKVLFFFSSIPTTVRLWPNFKTDFQYFRHT